MIGLSLARLRLRDDPVPTALDDRIQVGQESAARSRLVAATRSVNVPARRDVPQVQVVNTRV